MTMTPDDAGFIRTVLRFIYSDLCCRTRALTHLLAEQTGRPAEHLETDASAWIEQNLDSLTGASVAELERFVQERLGGGPAWWR